MKKYTPSVKNNNALRDEIAAELKAVVYRLEKGKYNGALDADAVAQIAAQLSDAQVSLENAICTGTENIGLIASDARTQIDELKKQVDLDVTHRVESAADEVIYTVGLWRDVLDGKAVPETADEIAKAKVSRSRKKLDARLDELTELRQRFAENGVRLDKEIAMLESDLGEYENAMLDEDSERKINELYRNVKTVKSKIDMLTVRQNNYSACRGLIDMIIANAKEILQAADFAGDEIGNAKALLNIDRVKKVFTDPDQAIVLLTRMDSEIRAIALRTATLDKEIFESGSRIAAVSASAKKYKEELLRKKGAKNGDGADTDGVQNLWVLSKQDDDKK